MSVVSQAKKPALSRDEMMEMILRLKAENDQLRAKQGQRPFWMKVSEKKALSVGIGGKWPVTLYAKQWEWLLQHAEAIAKFMEEHKAELSQGKED
jgi:hypothetical protein